MPGGIEVPDVGWGTVIYRNAKREVEIAVIYNPIPADVYLMPTP